MLRELQFKADFEKTVERFDAWWKGEVVDRPPVTLSVPRKRAARAVAAPGTMRERWMNAEYVVDCAIAGMEVGNFVGDTLPVMNPNMGPEITATLFGVELEFGESTAWSKPIVHSAEEWEKVLARGADFENVYWKAMEAIGAMALEKSAGRYLVGITDLHGNYDILAALRDPQELCVDLLECPDVLQRVCGHVTAGYNEAFERQYRMVAKKGMGSICWTPAYFEGRAYVPSCDFWCMVSDMHARECVLPFVLKEIAPLERSVFHLDGEQALRHLDLLLEIPELDAVQWVCGAGKGPAARWVDVYRRIAAAGKSAQVLADGPEDALAVLDAVGPKGLWLCAGRFGSVEGAENFLGEVGRRSLGR